MCLAIMKPKEIIIPKEYLENGFYNNDDGAGFAVIEPDEKGNDELNTYRGLFSFESFWKEWQKHEKKHAIIHFRNASAGLAIHAKTCHPFRINDNLVLAHNGYIGGLSIPHGSSDTAEFCDQIIKPLAESNSDFWLMDSFKWIIENSIGQSKLIMLDVKGRSIIFNEKDGNWKDEVWYSNFDYSHKKTWNNNWMHQEDDIDAEIVKEEKKSTTPPKVQKIEHESISCKSFAELEKQFQPQDLHAIDDFLTKTQAALHS